MGVLAAFLSRIIPFAWIIRIGAIWGALGLLLVSNMTMLWQLYLGFGVFFGGAMGFVYNACAASVVRWFPDNPSGVSGILLMAYGFSSMTLGPLYSEGIERFSWRRLFQYIALVCVALLITCSLFNRTPTEDERAHLPAPKRLNYVTDTRSIMPREMLRMPLFWMFFLWQILIAACGMTLSGHAAPMAMAIGVSTVTAALFAGLQAGGSGIGRVLFGFTYDRLGGKTLLLVNAIPIVGGILLLIAFRSQMKSLLAAAFFMLGIGFGGSPVCSTGFSKYTFGEEHYATNLSIVNLSALIASFLGPYVGGFLYEKCGYGTVIFMMLIFALAALIVCIPTVSQTIKRSK
jgi:OFA family oxalate/formate antiporter-like MFS transporter